jgi:hypothetical protein
VASYSDVPQWHGIPRRERSALAAVPGPALSERGLVLPGGLAQVCLPKQLQETEAWRPRGREESQRRGQAGEKSLMSPTWLYLILTQGPTVSETWAPSGYRI